MRIDKVEIDGFGKLNHVSLPFSGGFNLIVGDNESGKSTICEFLLAMFYDLPNVLKKTTKYDDGRKLYRPWMGDPFGGRVYFTDDNGIRYVLEKNFGKTKNSDRAKLLFADTWESAGDTENVGERFFGMGREGFLKTLYVKNLDANGSVGQEEILAKLSNMETGADEDISYEKIKLTLEKELGKIITKTGKGGKLPQLEEQRDALVMEKNMLLRKRAQRNEIEKQTEQLLGQAEKTKCERSSLEESLVVAKEHALFQTDKQAMDSREVLSARYKTECQRLTELKIEYESLEKKADSNVPNDALIQAKELEKQIILAEGKAELQKQVQEEQEAETQKKRKVKQIGLLLTAVGAVFAVLCAILSKMTLAASFAAFMVLGVGVWFSGLEKKKDASDAENLHMEERNRLVQELKTLCETYGAEDASSLQEMAHSQKQTQGKLSDMAKTIETLEQETERILESISQIRIPEKVEYTEAGMTYNGEPAEVLEERIKECSKKLEELQGTLQNIQLELARETAGEKTVAEVDSAIYAVEEEIHSLKEKEAAYRLAERWLKQAHREIKENFAPRLNQKTGEIFKTFTAGKYGDVRIGEEFALHYKNETGEITLSESLSRGTYDLLYISLRLATLEVLFSGRIPPVILDDAFSQMDDKRYKETATYLRGADTFGQVLYFTCHRENAEILNREDINLIDLNKEGVFDEHGLQD